jgi:predicted lipoprotein
MGVVTMLAAAAVMAVDQAAVAMTKAMTTAQHQQTHMAADRVHQTTWTMKSHSRISPHNIL